MEQQLFLTLSPRYFFQNHKTKKVRKISLYNLAVGCWMELPQPLICSLFWQEKYVKKTLRENKKGNQFINFLNNKENELTS